MDQMGASTGQLMTLKSAVVNLTMRNGFSLSLKEALCNQSLHNVIIDVDSSP
jgi:hypothetical protein